ncbi:hypothetical protein GCM10011608_02680 [Micromonospora sonchi]|uniref:Spore-associated protein A n=1 Tax=Micromonospora sonchi TaxID=1763543 RepID=A0A917TFP0_9ACTN|nr:hypothetical protein [Micromonospora sonchi]GGM21477.1 hypothetical protein GCM10011608_02680 [Micromonospora sonchi]
MRNTIKRKLVALASTAALTAGLLAATGGPAVAATCSGGLLGNWPIKGGYISVYYNSSTGYNCAMTHTNKPGVAKYIMVQIGSGGTSKKDAGTYKYYAGPVSVYGRGRCIDFSGQVGAGNAIEGITNAYCG